MIDDFSLLKKFLLIISLPLIFQFVFLGVLSKAQIDSQRAQRWVLHTKDVIAQTEVLSRHYIQAQNSVRGFLLTGDKVFINEYRLSCQRADASLKRLKMFVADNPSQVARVDVMADRARQLTGWLDDKVELMSAGRSAEAVQHVRELTGKQAFDGLRTTIDALLADEERLDQQRNAAVQRAWMIQRRFLIGAAVLTLGLVVGLLYLISRTFAVRVNALMDNVRRLTESKPLMTPIGGRDEIGLLDAAFHRMARSLNEREQENEMFIYSVSHDLRSPLVNLQGFGRELDYSCKDLKTAVNDLEISEADRARFATIIDEDIRGSVQFIMIAVRRLSSIIDALLRLSRAGRVEYASQPVDMHDAAVRVSDALRASASEKGAHIEVKPMGPALGDPTALEQVLGNLVNNAVKYLDPQRPGRIEVGEVARPSGPSNGPDRDRTYYVRDNGLGIVADHMPKLFQAFQRLHPSVAEGEGIGLAIVRRVIERHGGKIWVESKAGEGTTFFVRLPSESTSAQADESRKILMYGQGGPSDVA